MAIIVYSCKKENKQAESPEKIVTAKKEIGTASRPVITPNSVPVYCEDLENPCSDPACRPYYDCEEPLPTISLTSIQNVAIKTEMTNSFQSLNVNLSLLSSALGLPYTLSSSNIDFDKLSRSYIINDDGACEVIAAPFKTNSSTNPTNYVFCLTVDADSVYKPYIVKATKNQSLKYFDLDEGNILTINNYQNQNKLSFQNTMGNYLNAGAARAVGCGQATMDCITDTYSNHGWVSVWATVQSIFIPATGAAIAGACAIKNCIPRRARS